MLTEHSPAVSIPRLQTLRLTLREYRMADFDAFAAHLGDEESMAIHGVNDRRTAWRIFGANTGGWLLQGAGWWAIERRDSGVLVGNIGAFFREGWPEIELGWNTFRVFWGQGIASEAASEVLRHVFEERGERRATALVHHGNAPSLRVAAHLGMTYESQVDLFGTPLGRYVRARGYARVV
jgi:RimJ/RimL family protein N-acetyltransferase